MGIQVKTGTSRLGDGHVILDFGMTLNKIRTLNLMANFQYPFYRESALFQLLPMVKDDNVEILNRLAGRDRIVFRNFELLNGSTYSLDLRVWMRFNQRRPARELKQYFMDEYNRFDLIMRVPQIFEVSINWTVVYNGVY